jgi:hypothetical protein
MSPPTVSNTKILKPIDFLKDTGNKFSPKTFNMEIDTHDSSKKRALWNIRELYSTRWRLSKKFLEELRKDKIFHPMAIRQDFIQSESDGVLYCHHALFVPLLKLLRLSGEKKLHLPSRQSQHATLLSRRSESAGEEAGGRLDILVTAYKRS